MNNEFRLVKLGEIAQVSAGNSAPQDRKSFLNGSIPFVRVSDLSDASVSVIKSTRDYLTDAGVLNHGIKIHPRYTILIPKSGASIFLNHRAILDVDAAVSSHLAAIKASPSIDPSYLFYVLQNVDVGELVPKNGYPSLPLGVIQDIQIPLPPLPVQRRIAEILGSVDSIILIQKTLIEKLALLMSNIMQDQFSRLIGNRMTIRDIAEVQTGPFGSLLKSSSFSSKGVPVLNIGNVQQGFLDMTSLSFVNEDTANALKNYRLRQGDLLFSRMATVGRTCVVPECADGWLMSYHLIRLRIHNENILPQYVMYSLIGSRRIKHQVAIQSSGGTRSGVNTSILEGLVIDIPSLDAQMKLVNSLDVIQKRIAHGNLIIKRYKMLRTSLLHKLLSDQSREVVTI